MYLCDSFLKKNKCLFFCIYGLPQEQYTNWGNQDILYPGTHFEVGVLAHFVLKNHTQKTDKIYKIFELYKYSCIIFCVKMSYYSHIIYCFQEKSTHFGLGISVVYLTSNLCMLNCFKYFLIYILRQNVYKNQTRKILHYIKSLCAKLF